MNTIAKPRLTLSVVLLVSSAVLVLGAASSGETDSEWHEFKISAFARTPEAASDEPYRVEISIEDLHSNRMVGKPPVVANPGESTILEAFDPESGTYFKIELTVSTEVPEEVEAAVADGRIMRFPVETDEPDH